MVASDQAVILPDRYTPEALKELAKYYSQFDWHFYCHFTFAYEIPDFKRSWRIARYVRTEINHLDEQYIWEKFFLYRRILCEEIFGRQFRRYNLGLNCVVGLEEGRFTEHLHLHALIGHPFGVDLNNLICRMCSKALWEYIGIRTGRARIYNFDKQAFEQRGPLYLVKHQIKKANLRDFFVRNSRVSIDAGLSRDPIVVGNRFEWSKQANGIYCADLCKKFYNEAIIEQLDLFSLE